METLSGDAIIARIIIIIIIIITIIIIIIITRSVLKAEERDGCQGCSDSLRLSRIRENLNFFKVVRVSSGTSDADRDPNCGFPSDLGFASNKTRSKVKDKIRKVRSLSRPRDGRSRWRCEFRYITLQLSGTFTCCARRVTRGGLPPGKRFCRASSRRIDQADARQSRAVLPRPYHSRVALNHRARGLP